MCFVVGTVGWMAPEVQHDSEGHSTYNRSADVFSLGLLYLALVLHQLGRNLLAFTGNPFYLLSLVHGLSSAQCHNNSTFFDLIF